MDGFDVLSWIRQHPEFSELKVFVWTDSGDPRTLDRAIQPGESFVPSQFRSFAAGWPGWLRGISQAIPHSAEKERV